MFSEIMGFREGVLVLPNDRPLPIRIDCMEMSRDTIPEMRVSVLPGIPGRHMIDDFERRLRRRYERVDFLPFLPDKTPAIKKVIFNDPATIVIWKDDTKTIVKCQPGDTYSEELGLAMCISKKYLGNKGNFNDEFKKWIPEEKTLNHDIPVEETDDSFVGGCASCKYSDKGIFDKPCVDCNHNNGTKNNYRKA